MIGGEIISNRSYLDTPKGSFEISDCLGLGWIFLFKKEDGRINLVSSKDDDNDTEDEVCEYVTTAQKALENLERRLSLITEPYLKELFKGLEPLREGLLESPLDGEIKLNCYEFVIMGDENLIEFIQVLPEELEDILKKNDTEQFGALFSFIGPNMELTFDIKVDQKVAEEHGMTLSEALIGFRE